MAFVFFSSSFGVMIAVILFNRTKSMSIQAAKDKVKKGKRVSRREHEGVMPIQYIGKPAEYGECAVKRARANQCDN